MVWAAVLLVGTEVLALGVFGVKAWANVYFTPPSANAMPIQVQSGVHKLRGSPGAQAEIENSQMLFRADEIDFDQDSGDVRASGHVFFHNFERNMKMWAGHITYNTDEETGKF